MQRKPPKPKTCTICGEMFDPRRMGQKCCNPPASCMFEWAKREKARERTAETRKMKAKLRETDRAWHTKKAQDACNAYVRARDYGNNCISCGKSYFQEQMQAGHYKNVGSHPELRFDADDNIHAQCSECNNRKSANLIEYRKHLLVKIGADRLARLEGPHPVTVLTIDDLKAITAKYKAMKKEMT